MIAMNPVGACGNSRQGRRVVSRIEVGVHLCWGVMVIRVVSATANGTGETTCHAMFVNASACEAKANVSGREMNVSVLDYETNVSVLDCEANVNGIAREVNEIACEVNEIAREVNKIACETNEIGREANVNETAKFDSFVCVMSDANRSGQESVSVSVHDHEHTRFASPL